MAQPMMNRQASNHSIMRSVQRRMGRFVTVPRKLTSSNESPPDCTEPQKGCMRKTTGRSTLDGGRFLSRLRGSCLGKVSVRFPVVVFAVVATAVLVSCLGTFSGMRAVQRPFWDQLEDGVRDSLAAQKKSVDQLFDANLSSLVCGELVESISSKLAARFALPASQAVHGLWAIAQKGSAPNGFCSWEGDCGQILTDAAAVVLSDTANFQSISLYFSPTPGDVAVGVDVLCSGDVLREYFRTSGPLNSPTNFSGRWDSDACLAPISDNFTAHGPQGPPPPRDRPFYKVQSQLAQQAVARGSTPLRSAWSELFVSADGQGFMSWTKPISSCGDYSCFGGVVAADVKLGNVEQALHAVVNENRADVDMACIVNHESGWNPGQQGVVVGCAGANLTNKTDQGEVFELTRAQDHPDRIVRAISAAVGQQFGAWNASALRDPHMLRFRSDPILEDEPTFVECTKGAGLHYEMDCVQVHLQSIEMDEDTRWMVVIVLSSDNGVLEFARELHRDVNRADNELQEQLHKQVESERMLEAVVLSLSGLFSVAIALFLSCIISRPLRQLSSLNNLMLRLGQLDFARDTTEFAEVCDGHRSCIREVGQLQGAFHQLSRAVETFARFVPSALVRDVVGGDDRVSRLSVMPRNVTIMFSDIQNFTGISESLSQEDLLCVLTSYFQVMTNVAEHFEGTVTEILGDGLLVVWNTPDDIEDHAAKACHAALSMHAVLAKLNERLGRMDLPQLAIRIGLHTGDVLSGNLGSQRKMKFGCIGDPVNLASRLEGLCKNYGVGVVCSAATRDALPNDCGLLCRKLDLVQVKGKREPTLIYEVVGVQDSLASELAGSSSASTCSVGSTASTQAGSSSSDPGCISSLTRHLRCGRAPTSVEPEKEELVRAYEQALDAFQAARVEEARGLAEALTRRWPADVASQKLLERCIPQVSDEETGGARHEGPCRESPAPWTGVNVLTEK